MPALLRSNWATLRSSPLALGFALLSIANLAGAALSFAASLIIIHAGGAALFGQISLALTVTNYALLFAVMGTDVSAVRIAAAKPDQIPELLWSVFLLRLTVSVAAFALIWVALHFLKIPHLTKLLILLSLLSLFVNSIYPLWLPQALEHFKTAAICILGVHALNFALTAVAATWELGAPAFALTKVAGEFAVAIALMFWAALTYRQWHLTFAKVVALAQESFPIVTSQVVRGASFASDIIIVGIFFTPAVVGHYSAAYRVFTLLLSFGSMYFVALFPKLSRQANEDSGLLRRELRSSLRRALLATSVGSGLLMLLSPWILRQLFGAGFEEATLSFQLLLAALVANVLQRNYGRALLASGHARWELRGTIIATVFGVSLKVIATKFLGISGTAGATLATEILLLVLQRRYLKTLLTD